MTALLADAASLLELSAERDLWARARDTAWREGYATAAAEFEEFEARGYARAISDVKRTQHELVDAVRLGLARSAPGGAAWLAAVVRNGGTEYGGAGKPRVPVAPKVIELARGEQAGVKR